MVFRRILLAVLIALPLVGCEESRTVGTSDTNHIQYEKYGITRLKVGEIQIANTYVPTYHAPNVEHELYLPPYAALREWAQHRYQAVGNMGVAKIEILDASIKQKDVVVPHEILGMNDSSIQTEFRLRMYVRIQINSPNYIDLPYAETLIIRKIRFDDQTTALERNNILQNTVAEALDKLDEAMTKTIRDKWGNLVQ